jgi:hypothetical protein
MADPRPAEGPDREALVQVITDAAWEAVRREANGPEIAYFILAAVEQNGWRLALLPTPPAPGDERQRAYDEGRWCGECRYGVVEDPPCCTPAPGGGEGLRAEVERLRTYHVRVPEMNGTFLRRDDVLAALAARDTDQGAGDALAEAAKHMLRTVEGRAWRMTPYDSDTETRCSSLVGPDEPCGECIPCWTYNVTKAAAALRAALARATPEEDR